VGNQFADPQIYEHSMNPTFSNSAIVITGASRGIGRQIALRFAEKTDHALLLLARDQELLSQVREECLEKGCKIVKTVGCDLTNPEDIKNLLIPQKLPGIGGLINNAGDFIIKSLEETSLGEFQYLWELNARGPFLMTQKLLPLIKKQERGIIVNISSLSGLRGQSHSGAYSSSKHALLGFTRSLRLELKNSRIAVTAINLGQTMSSSWEGIDVNPEELIDPVDVADLIITVTQFSHRTVAEEISLRPQRGDRSPD
jgi:short-subunit dehydrogenase